MLKEKNVGIVYQVKVRWADLDSGTDGCQVKAYNSYESAEKAYKEAVKECVEEDCFQMFSDTEKHTPADGYAVEESRDYFLVYEDGFSRSNFEEITFEACNVYEVEEEND